MISTKLGYHHHGKFELSRIFLESPKPYGLVGIEYWQHASPPSEATTVECNADGEDSTCSASIPSHGVNLAHATVCSILVFNLTFS